MELCSENKSNQEASDIKVDIQDDSAEDFQGVQRQNLLLKEALGAQKMTSNVVAAQEG